MEYRCCVAGFFIRIAIAVFLVLFAGLMSGLTLGLMSLSLVDLEVLAKSGTPKDKRHAGILYLFRLQISLPFLFLLLFYWFSSLMQPPPIEFEVVYLVTNWKL